MTRIMLTADAVGGVWRYSLDLARGMLAAGAEPILVLLGPAPSVAQAAELRDIDGLQVIPTGLPLDWTAGSPEELRAAAAALAGLAGRLRVEGVHLHTPALAAQAPWSVPTVAVAHSCVATWWRAVRGGALPPDLAWRAEFVAHGLAEADAVVAPTHAFAAMLEAHYRPGRPIAVIHNGRDGLALPDIARTHGVLTAGRLWDEAKNVALLDTVAPSLDCPVMAAGALRGPGTSPGIEGAGFAHLDAPGPLTELALAREMAARTVYCAPARYEPFGLAVLEAAQSGMALALADIPTFRELWDGAALFFHPDDSAGLRDVLARLLAEPGPMADQARLRAADYPVDRMVAATLALHRPARMARREVA